MAMTTDRSTGISSDEKEEVFRVTDFPMHYFAAIQRQNFANMSRIMARIGITPLEWRVLAVLGERDSQTINEITAIVVEDRSKVSRVISKMTTSGMVVRDTASADNRRAAVRLTETGTAKLQEALVLVRHVYARNLDGLTEDELALLMKLLRRIKDNVFRIEAYQ